ncbi:hypothetical protein EXT57_00910 [Pectobacterium brasiliense]|uniref:hypothetical protein n=1 Tax=Pectobacterium brasiliense TaxID=180957 RepID=UPI00202DB628|nr:hypothetical protein [Pectobacterium brasiliense]MCL6375935.1 hypothetical protein [Pectobacterium brasiliense]
MSVSIDVSVRYTSGAYFARANGKTASCTYSAEVAVNSVGKKLFGNLQKLIVTQIKPASFNEKGHFTISPDLYQSCRVCNCVFEHACEGGCYWVESDLCSRCAASGA